MEQSSEAASNGTGDLNRQTTVYMGIVKYVGSVDCGEIDHGPSGNPWGPWQPACRPRPNWGLLDRIQNGDFSGARYE